MTGFGEAHRQADGVAVSVEVRTINNRYFKLTVRSPDGYNALEGEIEQLVRPQVKRGTVQVSLDVKRPHSAEDFRINAAVLEGYRQQLEAFRGKQQPPVPLEALLPLPGVVDEERHASDAAADWPLISATLAAAMDNLSRMRQDEGRAMAADLRANALLIAGELARIEARAPQTINGYRARLTDRIGALLAEYQMTLQPGDLIREIGLYAERSDVSEEIVRLKSHLEQFEAYMGMEESSGRKLEFITQEMFREVNTIGSKANDVEISRHVIEIKAAIEKIREMIQNVE
jgi:uncharacterized protein (TIGR00255 family)